MNIVHIINPVKVKEKSDLYIAQPITFESMRIARNFSSKRKNITLCTTQFEEDRNIIPPYFSKLSNLERDVSTLDGKLADRKLPLIGDIIAKLKEIRDVDYYIYSNVDIAVMPQFYDVVFSYISQGHDAIIINRRRLNKQYKNVDQLPLMYSDIGKSHPGFDCFVFHKDLLSKLVLGNICIGVPFIEATLVHNLFSFAGKPVLIDQAHLTFHLGMDVLEFKKDAFYKHNRKEFFKNIQPLLRPYFILDKFPYSSLPFLKRSIKWILNPSLFSRTYIYLEGKSFEKKIKALLNEIRWRILQR